MSNWNMPPGVSTNDIPGNRPEDLEEERFWQELDEKFIEQYGEKAKKWLTLNEDLDPEDLIWEYVRTARDLGAKIAIAQFQADVSESEYWEQEHLEHLNWQLLNWAADDKEANSETS